MSKRLEKIGINAEKKTGQKKTRRRPKSNFHFVINLNRSYRDFHSREQTKHILDCFRETVKEWKDNIHDFILDNEFSDSSKNNKLYIFKSYLEKGKERGFVHVDGYMRFSKPCMINIPEVYDFLNYKLRDCHKVSEGIYFNIKYIPDSLGNVMAYAEKDEIPFV